MPLYPIAFEQFDFTKFDLVISQTTRFAKSIITKPGTTHICYIHTPPRFLWNYNGEKTNRLLEPLFSRLRSFDKISAKRVDYWISGSENCRERVKKIYGFNSKVLYPFVNTEKLNPSKSFDSGYYLIISRLNKYKNVDIAVKAFRSNGKQLKIIGVGPELGKIKSDLPKNVEILGKVSDALLENLLAGCRGLIITAEEDFGMTSIEAQALGKGVICFGEGGVLETVIPGKTGNYFLEKTPQSLNQALEIFESLKINPADCFINAKKFSKQKFKERLLNLINDSKGSAKLANT